MKTDAILMNHDPQKSLTEYAGKSSEADQENIRKNLSGMNRGPIKKIWEDVQLLWKMVGDPTVPWQPKAIAIGALVYLVSPLDVVPDILPIIGLVDDVGVIVAAVGKLATELKRYKNR